MWRIWVFSAPVLRLGLDPLSKASQLGHSSTLWQTVLYVRPSMDFTSLSEFRSLTLICFWESSELPGDG